MSKITKIKLTEFSFDVPNIGLETAAAGVGNMAWIKDGLFKAKRFAVKKLNQIMMRQVNTLQIG